MKIYNKRAGFEYKLTSERVEAGLSLKGVEVKALRGGHGDISQSHVRFLDNEVFLINANIPAEGVVNYNPTRVRKLLLHKDQVISMQTKTKQGRFAIVPVKLYNKGRLIKIELAMGMPKRQFEKKESIKKKDIEREIAQQMKGTKLP